MGDSVIDASSNTVVLAFDLLDNQIQNMPSELVDSLQSDDVQNAIKAGLMNFAVARQKSGTTEVSDKEAQQFANTLLNTTTQKMEANVLKQLKQTTEYKKLEQSLNDLQTALKNSPVGMWVDRNAGVLYVVGAGLVLGGAAALYVTKTGGPAVNLPISQIKGKPVQFFKVGKFSLSGQLITFQPETRTLGASITGTEKWDKLQVSLQLGVVASGSDVKQIKGQAILKTPDINLGITGSAEPDKKTVNLGLSFAVTDSGNLRVGMGAVLKDGKAEQGTLNASLKTSAGDFGLTGSAGGREDKVMATWSWSF